MMKQQYGIICDVLVPFPGFLYLYKKYITNKEDTYVLVPFPGFLYLYFDIETTSIWEINVLVPFPGFLYLYYHLLYKTF